MKKQQKKSKRTNVVDTLNTRELAIVQYLVAASLDMPFARVKDATSSARGLHDIAVGCFDRKRGKSLKAASYFRANSWARNAVRRPLRERLIVRVGGSGTGMYKITAGGARLYMERTS